MTAALTPWLVVFLGGGIGSALRHGVNLAGTRIGAGFPFGTLPVGGSETPTLLSYLMEKRLSKNPEEFGKGAIEAVAGPEAANNAAAAGILAPLLALGLPTSATAWPRLTRSPFFTSSMEAWA